MYVKPIYSNNKHKGENEKKTSNCYTYFFVSNTSRIKGTVDTI